MGGLAFEDFVVNLIRFFVKICVMGGVNRGVGYALMWVSGDVFSLSILVPPGVALRPFRVFPNEFSTDSDFDLCVFFLKVIVFVEFLFSVSQIVTLFHTVENQNFLLRSRAPSTVPCTSPGYRECRCSKNSGPKHVF